MDEHPAAAPPAAKQMKLRYAGTCSVCGLELPARTEAIYDRASKTVRCVECPSAAESRAVEPEQVECRPAEPEPAAAGTAGSSARREYERRKANDEQRLREKWGRLGGIAVALSDEKQSTKAWATGAAGEERLGARLDALAQDGIVALHDRRIPGSRANIDHIVVTGAGIWVIDAKRYKGRPELKVEGGLFRPRVEKLVVGGRDCTALVDGALSQVEVVQRIIEDVPVTAALCFVDADWPLIGGSFRTRGVHVLWPRQLAKLLAENAPGSVDVRTVARRLADRLRPA